MYVRRSGESFLRRSNVTSPIPGMSFGILCAINISCLACNMSHVIYPIFNQSHIRLQILVSHILDIAQSAFHFPLFHMSQLLYHLSTSDILTDCGFHGFMDFPFPLVFLSFPLVSLISLISLVFHFSCFHFSVPQFSFVNVPIYHLPCMHYCGCHFTILHLSISDFHPSHYPAFTDSISRIVNYHFYIIIMSFAFISA